MDIREGGELEHEGLGGASQAGQRRGDHKGHQLELVHVVTQGYRPWLVFADRLENLAEG
jgi:hypothetical protein